ncbi:hypothetical protein LTR27_005898 [Elasticomyces elasticus]|nr:hypothetical protein LTR27_005898 [Elasticomyces elasticus]
MFVELLKQIYAFCYDPEDNDYADLCEDDEDGVVTVLEPALTRTCKGCKLIRTESLPIFYGFATFDTIPSNLYKASNSFTIDKDFEKRWLTESERLVDPYEDEQVQIVKQHLFDSLERSIRERGVEGFTAFDIERLVIVDPGTLHEEPTDLKWTDDEELRYAIIGFRSLERP